MAITNETSKVTYTATGGTTYDINFAVNTDNVTGDAIGVKVIYTDGEGTEAELVAPSEYTISGLVVTTVTAYSTGSITILRDEPFTQTVDLVEGGQFSAETIEDALDKLTFQNQQQQEQIGRVVKIPVTETADLTLPTAQARAGQALVFAADGSIDTAPGTPPKLYSPLVEYANDEITQYQGSFYRSKQATNRGNTPVGGTADLWWEKLSVNNAPWSDKVIYAENTILSYQGTLYKSLQDANEGNTPDSSPLWWEEVRTGGGVDSDFVLAEGISAFQVGAVDSSGEAIVADVSDSTKRDIIGIATATGVATDTVRFQSKGILSGFAGLTIGANYFANTTGGITAGTGFLANGDGRWFIGLAVAADTLLLDVREIQPEASIQDPVPIGMVEGFASSSPPVGWLEADGSAVSRAQYSELFAAIGTTWGVGDGSTTFNLPDLRGAFVRGTGSHGTETMANGSPYAGPAVGAFEDDQFQGHWHQSYSDDVTVLTSGGGASSFIRYQSNTNSNPLIATNQTMVKEAIDDGTNGTPNTGPETKPFAAGVLMCIKASRVTATGDVITALRYDTGWVANSDWTNAEFNITHNLGVPADDLIIEMWLSTSSDGSNPSRAPLAGQFWQDSVPSNQNQGITPIGIDNSSFKLQTGTNGFQIIGDDGNTDFIDTQAWYYRVVVYKPDIISTVSAGNVRTVTADYTITGRSDSPVIQADTATAAITVTLPDGSTLTPGDTFELANVDGTNEATLQRAGSDTIDGVTSVDVDSDGDLVKVRWTGTKWTVTEYKDHGSGSTNNWVRYADGTMVQWAFATAIDASPKVITFEKAFVSPPSVVGMVLAGNRVIGSGAPSDVTATDWDAYVVVASTGAADTLRSANWTATGRWRA